VEINNYEFSNPSWHKKDRSRTDSLLNKKQKKKKWMNILQELDGREELQLHWEEGAEKKKQKIN